MKFSVALPMLPPDHFLPLARAAEAAGYEGVAVPESVFFPEHVSADYPYSADGGRYWDATTPFLDPFVAIPAMAAVTERLKFFTNVLKLGIRDPCFLYTSDADDFLLVNIACAGVWPNNYSEGILLYPC